jgi:hypothetical protein
MNPTPTTRVLTRIRVECIDGDRWRVLEPFVVVTQRLGRIEVPAGFITDFNSTPRLLWNVLPPTECAEASVPHDLLYQRGELAGVKVSRRTPTRCTPSWSRGSGAPTIRRRTIPTCRRGSRSRPGAGARTRGVCGSAAASRGRSIAARRRRRARPRRRPDTIGRWIRSTDAGFSASSAPSWRALGGRRGAAVVAPDAARRAVGDVVDLDLGAVVDLDLGASLVVAARSITRRPAARRAGSLSRRPTLGQRVRVAVARTIIFVGAIVRYTMITDPHPPTSRRTGRSTRNPTS